MQTKQFKIEGTPRDEAALDAAAALLCAGKLVVIPTETVYGLAANALDPAAAAAIYTAKGRPCDNPLIVHIASLDELPPLVKAVPDALYRLADRFWPGPMTVILEKSDLVPSATTGGLDTVAVRMPAHPAARALIRRAGVPLAAPSANLSGSPSPTCARHCIDDLDGRVDAIVDGGPCEVGLESTVLTLCEQPPQILRPGAVTLEMARQVLADIELGPGVFERLPDGVRAASPGMKYKHYAPKARVVLVHAARGPFADFLASREGRFGALCLAGDEQALSCPCIVYGAQDDAASQAHGLFDALRQIDRAGLPLVYARVDGAGGVGQAVYNRLLRAAGFEELWV